MRTLLVLMLTAACAAHDLGYLQLDLAQTPGGARLTATGDTGLLAVLPPPRVPAGYTVQSGPATAGRRVFTLAGAQPLAAGDLVVLPWPRSGAIVTARWADGHETRTVVPRRGAAIVLDPGRLGAQRAGAWRVLREHLALGLDHILAGIDHLAFVAGLMLLVQVGAPERRGRRLVVAITAFTLGHSLSLGAVTLGLALPGGMAVEALIALSIVVLATEVVHARRGRPGWSCRHPALIAAGFGLLHGLGFAAALAELGLPRAAIPLALLGFNLGIEVGQLAVVALLLLLVRGLRPAIAPRTGPALTIAAYVLGTVAATWTLGRIWA